MEASKGIFVFDGHSMIFRAYFAMIKSPLINNQGKNVSAVHGFFQMLFSVIDTHKPSGVLIVFDNGKKSFRNDLYPEYKGKRDKAPQDLIDSIPVCIDITEKMGFSTMIAPDGYEGDDAYGSIATQLSKKFPVSVVTGDKDAFQLLSDNVNVLLLKGINTIIYDIESFSKDMKIEPSSFIDLKALMGDSSDNIPGITKIGEKSALEIIQKYKNIEGVYENIEDFSGKRKEYLKAEKENAFLFRDIVTIRKNLDISLNSDNFNIQYDSNEKFILTPCAELKKILSDLELTRILGRLFSGAEENISSFEKYDPEKVNYRAVKDIKIFEMLIESAIEKNFAVIDLETDSLDPHTAKIAGIAFCVEPSKAWYIPISHNDCSFNHSEKEVFSILKRLFNRFQATICGHNLKYDLSVFKCRGLECNCNLFDTMVASWLISSEENRFSLSECAKKNLSYEMIQFSEIVEKNTVINDAEFDKVVAYACEDADITIKLYNIFKEKLVEEELVKPFYEMEMPLVRVLMQMELTGIDIDDPYLVELNEIFDLRLEEINQKLFEIAGEEFNPRSVKQLAYILFDKLQIPPLKKNKTGYSTDVSVLEELAGNGHEICILLMEHRELSKLKGNYGEKLIHMVNQVTGRIHTSYNQCGTQTGRLSSSEPNLQNIPVKTETGMRIRKCFCSKDPEKCLLSIDYSQIELRLLAHFSDDPSLVECYRNGLDVHQDTASQLFSVNFNDVTTDMRRFAKTINFGLIYGMGSFKLSKQLKISRKQAQEYIDIYFSKYSKVESCLSNFIEQARKNGYAETIFMRKRKIKELEDRNKIIQKSGERIAMNTPVQGSAADLIKLAMNKISDDLLPEYPDARMLLQVHDELVFEIPKTLLTEFYSKAKEIMISAYKFSVPLEVNGKWGVNLAEMQEI